MRLFAVPPCGALLLALLLAGCSHPLNPLRQTGYERRPGTLTFYGDSAHVVVPELATVGTPFTITIRTYGGGCMKQGGTDLRLHGLTADIRPYDYEAVNLPMNTGCPAILVLYQHEAQVTFSRSGAAILRIHGWSEPEHVPVVIERTVVVQP